MSAAVRAYVAFGANLGEPLTAFAQARAALDALPATQVAGYSSCYRTAPVGVGDDQPDYINAVIAIDTALPPQDLLAALLAIEHAGGRTRDYHQAPRTMDLDLLLYGDACIDTPGLIVPHPRMHLRAFVLHPLLELAPELTIPGIGPAHALLPAMTDQAITRL